MTPQQAAELEQFHDRIAVNLPMILPRSRRRRTRRQRFAQLNSRIFPQDGQPLNTCDLSLLSFGRSDTGSLEITATNAVTQSGNVANGLGIDLFLELFYSSGIVTPSVALEKLRLVVFNRELDKLEALSPLSMSDENAAMFNYPAQYADYTVDMWLILLANEETGRAAPYYQQIGPFNFDPNV